MDNMVSENLATLQRIKNNIKQAIINKGVEVSDDFNTYAAAVNDLGPNITWSTRPPIQPSSTGSDILSINIYDLELNKYKIRFHFDLSACIGTNECILTLSDKPTDWHANGFSFYYTAAKDSSSSLLQSYATAAISTYTRFALNNLPAHNDYIIELSNDGIKLFVGDTILTFGGKTILPWYSNAKENIEQGNKIIYAANKEGNNRFNGVLTYIETVKTY